VLTVRAGVSGLTGEVIDDPGQWEPHDGNVRWWVAVPTAGPLPQIDLARLRQHETSQQRAWEEFGYILVPDIDGLPSGTRLERRATPDAGVEFSCAAPPPGGGTRAWQGKYLFRLDADAFKQMTRSVEDALDANPTLTRYAFVLPVDG
jgi:hypothetical protein